MLASLNLVQEFITVVNNIARVNCSADYATINGYDYDKDCDSLPWIGNFNIESGRTLLGYQSNGSNASLSQLFVNEKSFTALLSSVTSGNTAYMVDCLRINHALSDMNGNGIMSGCIDISVYMPNARLNQCKARSVKINWNVFTEQKVVSFSVESSYDFVELFHICCRVDKLLKEGPAISSALQDQNNVEDMSHEIRTIMYDGREA